VNEASEGGRKGWLDRLARGLKRSSSRLGSGITGILKRRRLDKESLAELEDLLIAADLGPATAAKLTAELARERLDKEITDIEVREFLAGSIAGLLEPVARPLIPDRAKKPFVVLVVGVNGSGKTTTIGKLARFHREQGKRVLIAACDTFRAAAIEQLKIWGERAGVPVIARESGADPAGLAFDALARARAEDTDLLLIDTAGRLHNRADLMAELSKIVRVLRKLDPEAPEECLLVLDATVGQNALQQVETFLALTQVTGLVITKLDGTAKGGVLLALAERFGLPVRAIGIGESVDDLRPFEARAFARSLLGLESAHE
jgi:fused signal recognition particle receptor